MRTALSLLCGAIPGRVSAQVGRAEEAMVEIKRSEPPIALLDMGLSDLQATEVVRIVLEANLRTRCVLLAPRRTRSR